MEKAALSWRSRLWRWRWLILLAIIVVVVRAAVPLGLRYVLVSQGSQILQSRVDVGNVDLWLLRGAVAIDDFALRPGLGPTPGANTPVSAEAPTKDNPAESAASADDDLPLVAWKHLLVDIEWLPLWNKIVRLSDLTLEAPRIAVDRLASGHFSYEPVLRAALEYAAAPATPASGGAVPTATPTAIPESTGPGWQVGLDHVIVRDGGVRFADRMLKDSEPIDIGIPTVDVKEIALSPGLYGDKSRAQLHLGIDDGTLDIDARVALLDTGFWLETNIEAKRLPLRRSRLYVPGVGWSELVGELDLSLWYGLETGVRDNLEGTVTLRDVSVTVPDLTDSALAWKQFQVRIDDLDLLGHTAKIGGVDLTGAVITVRLYGTDRLPLLQTAVAATQEEEAAPTPPADAPSESADTAEEAPPAASPWQWSVGSVNITDSKVHGLTTDTPLDIAVALAAKTLASTPGATTAVELSVRSEVGNVHVTGDARLDPPGFGGVVKVDGLTLPRVAALSGAVAPEMVQSGTLQTELTVAAGMAAPGSNLAPAERDVLVQGTLTFADPRLAFAGGNGAGVSIESLALGITQLSVQSALPAPAPAPPSAPGPISFRGTLALANPLVVLADGKEFSLAAKSLDLGITELSVPPAADAVNNAAAQPLRVALGRLRLDAPVIRVTRVPEGIVLPSFSLAAAQPAASSGASPAPSPAGTPAAVPSPTAAVPSPAAAVPSPAAAAPSPDTAAPPPVEVAVDTLQLTGGRLDIADRTVKPPFNGKLSPIALSGRDIRWPALAVKQLRLAVTTPTQGVFEITGDLSPKGGILNIDGKEVSMMPYNSYASTYSPYRVSQGSFSMSTKVTIEGGRYDAKNTLTLHELNVESGGGESAFEKEFGIPVSMALALMRDTKGDIGLDIPVQVNPEGTQIDLLAIAGGALRRALMGALASPLKMFGAMAGGSASSLVPAAIDLRPGRAEFAKGGSERAEQIGALLKSRPALAVEIDTTASAADVRWLQEQALLEQWNSQGVLGAIGGLMQRGTRDRVRQVLEAHAKDETVELSAEDAAALDTWLAALPPVTPQQLQALNVQRMGVLETALRDQSGIAAERIRRGEVDTEVIDTPPALRIQLQPVTVSSNETEAASQNEM